MPIPSIDSVASEISAQYQEMKATVTDKKQRSDLYMNICKDMFAAWGPTLGYQRFGTFLSDVKRRKTLIPAQQQKTYVAPKHYTPPTEGDGFSFTINQIIDLNLNLDSYL